MSSGKTIGLIKALGGTGDGGGGTSDAVQYIPQELTESQQMQARKNLGVYYTEGKDFVQLVPETSVSGIEQSGLFATSCPYFEIVSENIYRVTLNGKSYVLEPSELNSPNGILRFLGSRISDLSKMQFEWNYPFFLISPDGENTFLYLQEAGDHVISVDVAEGEIHKIQKKYLPNQVVIVHADESGLTDYTDQQIVDMANNGISVFLSYPLTPDKPVLLPYVSSADGAVFCGYVYDNGVNSLFSMRVTGNDIIVSSGYLTNIRLTTSTGLVIPSTSLAKNFSIRVDDNGTLSAEEVFI